MRCKTHALRATLALICKGGENFALLPVKTAVQLAGSDSARMSSGFLAGKQWHSGKLSGEHYLASIIWRAFFGEHFLASIFWPGDDASWIEIRGQERGS